MFKTVVFDMDNTLVDEFGSTVRPGMIDFLKTLKSMNINLCLWTNSTKGRAKDIIRLHGFNGYFSKYVFREDYDPEMKGVRKDIRKIHGELLIDDDPGEIEYARKLGLAGYLIRPYRKNGRVEQGEYAEIMKMIRKGGRGILGKIFS